MTRKEATTSGSSIAKQTTFTLDQAMAAQAALRAKLGLPQEVFPVAAFVGMLSDEIEMMRGAGHTDIDTAAVISSATGLSIDADAIARFYATPDQRSRHRD